jgi:hypothetical protein
MNSISELVTPQISLTQEAATDVFVRQPIYDAILPTSLRDPIYDAILPIRANLLFVLYLP